MPFEPPSYADALRACVRGYDGAHSSAVLRAPDVFELFARLFAEPDLPDHARPIINAVLAYFVAPHDVMPEEDLGPFGLLDDLHVAAHAYHLLRRELPEDMVAKAWRRRGKAPPASIKSRNKRKDDDGDGDVDEVMAMVRTEARAAVGKSGRAALKMAGFG